MVVDNKYMFVLHLLIMEIEIYSFQFRFINSYLADRTKVALFNDIIFK